LSDKEHENREPGPPGEPDSGEQNPDKVVSAVIMFGPLDRPDTLEYLSDIEPGDPIEICRTDPDHPNGVWQQGFVAASGLITGSADGQYPGEPIVWMSWGADYERAIANGQPITYDEWPADSLRFDRHPELNESTDNT
jgi:hypothetical protein